ncbi:hypothetical protein ACFYRI_23400 [Streptomyces microflavus]|uniref:hypothetical protein n=1 Tax=Streptomyces microflavus TaxID=1919 RepID=UPI00367BD639
MRELDSWWRQLVGQDVAQWVLLTQVDAARRLHLRSPCAGRAYAPAMTTTPNPHTARQDQDPGWGVTAS